MRLLRDVTRQVVLSSVINSTYGSFLTCGLPDCHVLLRALENTLRCHLTAPCGPEEENFCAL